MRTPWTKRIDASRRIYLTDSPGQGLQGLMQPLEDNIETVTNAEWNLARNADGHGKRNATRQTRTTMYMSNVDPDVFEDDVEIPDTAESDLSPSDEEYHPHSPNAAHSSDSGSAIPFTAKEKGKAVPNRKRASPRHVGDHPPLAAIDFDQEDTPAIASKPVTGRPTREAIAAFREFGQATQCGAQALATFHNVNIATVMRHSGLGAMQGTRAPSDFNTFKKLWAARTFAATGCRFALMEMTAPC